MLPELLTNNRHILFTIYASICIVSISVLYKLFKLRKRLIEDKNNARLNKPQERKRPRYIHNRPSKCVHGLEYAKQQIIKAYRYIRFNKIAYVEFVCILINCLLIYSYYKMFHLVI